MAMAWIRTGLAIIAIALIAAVVRYLTDEKTTFIFFGGLLVAFIVMSLIMDDHHATWIVQTRNIPAWGQFVALGAVIVVAGPVLFNAVKSAFEAVVASLQGTQCLISGAALVAFIAFVVLNRRRPRQNNQNHTNAP